MIKMTAVCAVDFGLAVGMLAVACNGSLARNWRIPRGDGQSSLSPTVITTSAATPANAPPSFGRIVAGDRAQRDFVLSNDSEAAIQIATVRTSCECLRVDLTNRTVRPHEAVTAQATIDLSDEPDFSGGFCPEVEFLDGSGQVLFVREFRANVVPEPTSSR